jgi:hypothetical protein
MIVNKSLSADMMLPISFKSLEITLLFNISKLCTDSFLSSAYDKSKKTVSEVEFPFLAIQSNPIYVLHFFKFAFDCELMSIG